MTEKSNNSLPGKLSDQEVGILLEQLMSGVSQQEPLDDIFNALAEDVSEPRLRAVAKHLADQFAQGADMATATASIAGVFPAHMRGALTIGVQTGNLSGILAGLSESELARIRMQRGLRSALAYPLLVVTFLMAILLFLSLVVVPQFREIYEDFALDLPYVTLYTLRLAEALPKVVLYFGGFVIAIVLISFLLATKRFVHWIRTSLPLLGRTWIWSGQHEFATFMSNLTQQQVPITAALACTIESLRDRNLAWASQRVNERCLEGATLTQSMRESIHFDPTLTSLTEWGETNQSLPFALRQAAETYEQQMELFTQFLNRIMPPLMLTFVATTLLVFVTSLVIPLIDLINGLTG